MKKAIPALCISLLVLLVLSSCGAPNIRPGHGSYTGYHHRKHYKHQKADYLNPRMKGRRRN